MGVGVRVRVGVGGKLRVWVGVTIRVAVEVKIRVRIKVREVSRHRVGVAERLAHVAVVEAHLVRVRAGVRYRGDTGEK